MAGFDVGDLVGGTCLAESVLNQCFNMASEALIMCLKPQKAWNIDRLGIGEHQIPVPGRVHTTEREGGRQLTASRGQSQDCKQEPKNLCVHQGLETNVLEMSADSQISIYLPAFLKNLSW